MIESLKNHWQEYLIEAWGLGVFMIAACVFGTFLFNPKSPFHFQNPFLLNVLMGLAMGLTAICIILSPWGKRSGAHINPSVTITFFRLGKIEFRDAAFYVFFQFIGGSLGVLLSWLLLGTRLENAAVKFVVTVPGTNGSAGAFAAEFIISFLLMTMVLVTSNSEKLSKYTAYFAGFLVAVFIVFEAQYSGMSMNPARTFGSAIVANVWTDWWIYFTSPVFGMLFAAEIYVRAAGKLAVKCAKLHHQNRQRCIFCGKPDERFIQI